MTAQFDGDGARLRKETHLTGWRLFRHHTIKSSLPDLTIERELAVGGYSFPPKGEKWTTLWHEVDSAVEVPFVPLSTYADISVGVTTGANSFFSIQEKTIDKFGLEKYVKPLLGKSNQAR